MVYPVHGESDISTSHVQDAKVQKTGTSYESNLQGGKKLITVQHGETLSGIARKYQTTIRQIISLNGLQKPDEIKAGQRLWVNASEDENFFKLNHAVAAVAEIKPKQESSPAKGDNPVQTVEIFVNNEKENVSAAEDVTGQDQQNYTILFQPITSVPVQVSEETPTVKSAEVSSQGTVGNSAALSRGQGTFTKEDVELLARVIHAEARGEDFEGQVAVGAVVLNRLEDSRFPKTIHSVIYQQGAFTAVLDKQIHLTPDEAAYRAAEAALEGKDPTGGAIYYYNPKTATDRWIKSRPVIKTIGNHTFSI